MADGIKQDLSDESIGAISTGDYSPITINVTNNKSEIDSLLKPLLIEMVDSVKTSYRNRATELPPDIEEKIDYNRVKVFKDDLRDAINYVIIIDEMIENLNHEDEDAADSILWSINQRYRDIKKELFLEHKIDPSDHKQVIKCINSHADIIINAVKDSIESDIPSVEGKKIEIVRFCILLIVCYGFITCNILERPIS